jgi:hypothetical protein
MREVRWGDSEIQMRARARDMVGAQPGGAVPRIPLRRDEADPSPRLASANRSSSCGTDARVVNSEDTKKTGRQGRLPVFTSRTWPKISVADYLGYFLLFLSL